MAKSGRKSEETGHARWLERVLTKLPAETRAAPANYDQLETAHNMVKVPVANVRADIATLEDAYQLAHELESSEVNRVS